jgi:hypothetical protein
MKLLSNIFFAATLVISASQVFAQSSSSTYSDSTTKVDRKLSGFSEIKVGGPFEVHITQGSDESIKYEAPKELADRMMVEIDGNTLKIRNKHDNWGWGYNSWYGDKSVWRHVTKKIVVYLVAKEPTSIVVSGSGAAIFEEGITAKHLSLRMSGSGRIVGKIDVKKLTSHISGSGEIKLSGNAETSTVRVAGSGKFASRNLTTVNSAALVSGSGRVEVNASDKVDATVHGSGGVSYTGTAKIINSTKSGSGEISRF